MKKILILALTAVASLGLTYGTTIAFYAADSYDIESLDDLVGKTIILDNFPASASWTINGRFNSDGVEYESIIYNGNTIVYKAYDSETTITACNEGAWVATLQTINIYTNQTMTAVNTEYALQDLADCIVSMSDYNTPIPTEEQPTMWQAILSGIGGFFAGMFSVLSGLFSGVVAVFYTNNTTTIVLQALIFAAAAGLVAAAVYVIVRLIKSAVSRLRGGVGGAGGYYINDKRVSRFAFKRDILKNEGRESLRSWKKKNRRFRRLARLRRK